MGSVNRGFIRDIAGIQYGSLRSLLLNIITGLLLRINHAFSLSPSCDSLLISFTSFTVSCFDQACWLVLPSTNITSGILAMFGRDDAPKATRHKRCDTQSCSRIHQGVKAFASIPRGQNRRHEAQQNSKWVDSCGGEPLREVMVSFVGCQYLHKASREKASGTICIVDYYRAKGQRWPIVYGYWWWMNLPSLKRAVRDGNDNAHHVQELHKQE